MTPRGHLGAERVEQHKPVLGSLKRLCQKLTLCSPLLEEQITVELGYGEGMQLP